MATFTVEATKRIFLRTTIEAENIEQAQKIADELIVTTSRRQARTSPRPISSEPLKKLY
jgi:predicted TIM-barrel enzyme